MKKAYVWAVVLTAVAVLPGWAQVQGRVEGRVVDTAGNPLEKVAVNIVSQRTSSVRFDLATDKNGKFLQIGITPGDYVVSFKKDGFAPASKETHVGIDATTRIDMELKPVVAAAEKALTEADRIFLNGNKLYADQKFPEAVAAYENAIRLDPGNWRYELNLGLAFKKMDRSEEALAAFHKAAELSPESFSANKEAGEALAKAGRWDEARPFYEKAVALNPDDPDAHYNLGLCLSSLGEPEGALAQFRKAVEVKPDYADAYYEMGTLLIGQNKVPEAVVSLEKFLTLAPDHPKAGVAKQLLQALKK
jgi:tetratricopeptide (TPR) repeat protein